MTMTTIEVLVTPTSGTRDADNATDPYRYGWRYVRRDQADGTYVMEQVPLTLEDVLHPQEGDQVTHSNAHQRRRKQCVQIKAGFLPGRSDRTEQRGLSDEDEKGIRTPKTPLTFVPVRG